MPEEEIGWGTTNFVYQLDVGSNSTTAATGPNVISWNVKKNAGEINPVLYFKYVKSKFNYLQRKMIESRIEKLEKAFDEAVEAGQDVLAKKFLDTLNQEAKEIMLLAKGFDKYVERDIVLKYKNQIRGGHISNTLLKDFTRIIPKKILDLKKKAEGIVDDFEIYHYWNEEEQQKVEKKEKICPEEKAKMRDPVMFGLIKGSNRMYFIGEWDDEYCDLSFNEMIGVMGKVKHKIAKKPDLNV